LWQESGSAVSRPFALIWQLIIDVEFDVWAINEQDYFFRERS
jgi:hypothetical protein